MRYLSLFSGIGGIDLAMDRAGWECVGQCEKDPAAMKVLRHHWPNVPKWTDVTELRGVDVGPVDAVVGGWPCQDLSVAGRRAGLAGQRSGLFFEFIRIARECNTRWILGENVPGLLSSNGGRDMGTVLREVAQLGMGYAYRVLDAQHFGVPQRRRRVFIVGHSGAPWSAPVQVLFEPESVRRNPPPRREATPGVAYTSLCGLGSGGADDNDGQAGRLVTTGGRVSMCLNQGGRFDGESETFVAATVVNPGRQWNSAQGEPNLVTAFSNGQGDPNFARDGLSFALDTQAPPNVGGGATVRRLTPLECERLQGLPDGWTEPAGSDSARYRCIGNSVAEPCVEWITRRMAAVESSLWRCVAEA